ncbi:hypothetical protein ACVIG9_007822 [Bradyrhizobium ottawaense]
MAISRNASGHSQTSPVFNAVITAATAAEAEPRKIAQKFCTMELMRAA